MKFIKFDPKNFTPASHENPQDPGVWKNVMLTHQDLIQGTVPMVNWARLPQGKSFALHYHETMQEIFIMVAGQAEMQVEKQKFILNPKDMMVVDKNEVHLMRNIGEVEVEYLVFGISENVGGKTVVVDKG